MSTDKVEKFIVVGSVDHGKSTLCGHLLYLTGYVSEHEFKTIEESVENTKLKSWKYARILDIYEEERQRGKTHEFNVISWSYQDRSYQLIDTPGHKQFIRSMIEGLYFNRGVVGCLMVSLAPGEFEAGFGNGQTKEDAILLRCAGLLNIIVLMNKADLIKWDETIYKKTKEKLEKFLKNLKFNSITFIPVSGFYGIGLIDTKNMPEWYTGKSFLDELHAISEQKASVNALGSDEIVTGQIISDMTILDDKTFITAGYRGIFHYRGGEIDYEIQKMSKDDKPLTIARFKDKVQVNITFEKPIKVAKNDRLIFRDMEKTIGFGSVLKIKPFKKN